MISAQRLAETVHRSVLAEISARRADMARQPLPLLNGLERDPAVIADNWVQDIARQLQAARHHRAYDESTIRAHAENYAALCSRMGSVESRRSFALHLGIEPPAEGKRITRAGVAARLDDPMWWRRQLRKAWTRASEDALREIGSVRKGRQAYASDAAVEHRAARQAKTREWMQSRAMVNETGEQLELLQLADRSIANPAIRRGEFMTRVRGFEELADSLGHVALFFTLTTPSRFHAHHAGGGVNDAWEAADRPRVRDGQQWLCRMWARARAELARRSVLFYGVRVAEPHHDGTPHWHAVLFTPAHRAADLEFILRQHWMSDAGTERGAAQFRIDCKAIDRDKGSAVGYVAKYISKNIDAFGAIGGEVDTETGEIAPAISDETGAPVMDAVRRVAAWASVHGIRQFQQLGGPPVGLWRELRRLREPVAPAVLETARDPASRKGASWAEFIGALGGIERARRRVGSVRGKYARTLSVPKVRALRLAAKQWRDKCGPRVAWATRDARPEELPAVWLDRAEARATDRAGRDVLAATRYGEAAGVRPAGVCAFGLLGRYVSADTRPHRWRIERRAATTGHETRRTVECVARFSSESAPRSGVFSDLGPVAITVRGPVVDLSAGMDWSWVLTVPFSSRAGPLQ